MNTAMRPIVGAEHEALVESILRRIAEDEQVVGAPDRTQAWERGWREALDRFKRKPVLESLVPAFIHLERPVRYRQAFYEPSEGQNELTFVHLMQEKIGDWLSDCPVVVEFGCGTGYNLLSLAERFPEKHYYGFDFVDSAVELVNEAGWALQREAQAFRFDMRKPNGSYKLGPRIGAFTFGAVEQLAGDFQPFIEYLIDERPKVVVHVEPTIELLDQANEVDALAIAFMQKRGYTSGFLPALQSDPRIEVLTVERSGFGSLMIEGYNLIAWRPL